MKTMTSVAYGVSSASVFTKTGNTGVRTAAQDLTDDEIRNVIPEGCTVTHKKYGTGTVKAILEGKIDVLFEDSGEKVFAANLCINNRLLTVI